MKFLKLAVLPTALLAMASTVSGAIQSECSPSAAAHYAAPPVDYTSQLQEMIDTASRQNKPVVRIPAGHYILNTASPIIMKSGVSLHGDPNLPTVLTVADTNTTATISVPKENHGWSIKNIVFDNVNINIDPHENEDETSILGNLFLNGGRGSVMAQNGSNLFIDGNVFLRDFDHRGTVLIPNINTTNTGVLFQSQKSSTISNNIFGLDMRKLDDLLPHVAPQVHNVLMMLKFLTNCVGKHIDDQQGFLASGIQLYTTNDIIIKENILNGTFPDNIMYGQDHGISIVGSNSTFIYQNFFAGWQLADFGGAARFTSAVDGYVISNYLANTAVMMYAATHADFMQVHNMVVHNNFIYRFLDKNVAPPEPLDGWLYEGITFYDFWTARLNYTIKPPIWNSSVPISPWAWHIVISANKFAAAEGIDPNVISMGNMDPREALIDKLNCYVSEPLLPGSQDESVVPLLWRQSYEPGVFTKNGGKVPKKFDYYTNDDLEDNVPAHLRNLPIPSFWKAFTLRNDTIPMMDPHLPCRSSL